MDRYVCIHCHFYQPPRENPWLEAVEQQDSAYPYHDWNSRITAECYAPNAAARILDGEGRIASIVNNYSRISFNFGPTLLSWLQENEPSVYLAIQEADKESRERFSGHGSALAQAYNHMILPLADAADRRTQVLWGIYDFKHRFGREPEGMWLPETAVGIPSLESLAELGLSFTILAPHQAKRVRRLRGRAWRDVSGARIDPTRPYLVRLPSGRSLAVFFYDGPISRAVAFEKLLERGEHLTGRLVNAYADQRDWPQLVHIATDGETYGHHHRHGEMALAYSLHHIESNNLARVTNYGEYLERHPPTHEVEIFENTSWSCAHGIERWRSDCGCNSGGRPGWNQGWRAPLRAALDWLRDTLAPLYEDKCRGILKDPWQARDDYLRVVLDRSPSNLEEFLALQSGRKLDETERVTALKLLELQRHCLLMYTSCGWFFDELSGLETVQVMQYAGRALQLSEDLFGHALEAAFLERLACARSNIPAHGDGAQVYRQFVKPAAVDLEKVAAHYAISSLFESYAEQARVYAYEVVRQDYRTSEAGRARLVTGLARFTSEITSEAALLSFGVLHLGDHNMNGGVRAFQGEVAYQELVEAVAEPFSRADFPEIIRLFDRHFGESTYSLKSLFRDEQRKIVGLILESTLNELESIYRQTYEHHAPLMRFLGDIGTPLPSVFRLTAEFVLNNQLRRALELESFDTERVRSLLETATREQVELDTAGLAFTAERTLNALMEQLRDDPADLNRLEKLGIFLSLLGALPFEIRLWRAQNLYYDLTLRVFPEFRARADQDAQVWLEQFVALGEQLAIRPNPH